MAVDGRFRFLCLSAYVHAACRVPSGERRVEKPFLAARSSITTHPQQGHFSVILARRALSEDSESSGCYSCETTDFLPMQGGLGGFYCGGSSISG
jgi:hypothetical protein